MEILLVDYEKEKFVIVAMRMLEMDDCIASKHYAEHVGKPYYQRLVDFMASDRIVALVVEGENANRKSSRSSW